MATPNANQRLAEVMSDAGLSAKSLARAVRQLSESHGTPVSCDHTSVSRWLAGVMPRERTAQLIVEALSSRLGRVVSRIDAGFTGYDDPRLVDASASAKERITGPEAVDALWSADLNDARALVNSCVIVGAWSDAALTWLVRADDPLAGDGGRVKSGRSDVGAIRATVGMFAALDGTYGGGHARRSLIQFLQTGLLPLLKSGASRDLQEAAAEALLLSAWMSYDAGHHGLAQRYFIQALHFADQADSRLLGASILDAMSHQATFLGQLHDAANLASAARSGSRGVVTPSLEAHFAAMEARAYAAAGEVKRAEQALVRAARAFERRNEASDPDWFEYFDDAELNAELGHCFRDIGRPRDAVTHADQAISGSSARSDFFITMVKARAYLRRINGQSVELEAACATARTAVQSAQSLKSARCVEYVRDFRRDLAAFASEPVVGELDQAMAESSIWVRAGGRPG